MASLGSSLRQAREKKGVSLDDVSESTRIPARLIRALEEESLHELPGRVYSRGYLRTYADYLGLDVERVIAAYDAEEQRQVETGRVVVQPSVQATMQLMAGRQSESATFGGKAALGVVGLTGIAALVFLGLKVGVPMPTWETGTAAAEALVVSRTIDELDSSRAVPVSVRLDLPTVGLPEIASTAPDEIRPPEEAPARSAPPSLSQLVVPRSGVGTDVVDSELVGRSEAFDTSVRVAFWTHVTGGRAGDSVRHVWYHEGQQVGVVVLPVGGPSWRTHSRRVATTDTKGQWTVEAQDESGRVLARHEFRYVS